MKYCIIGAGSVGGYFGARLQQAGESVTFLVRQGRKDQLLKEGLNVRSYLGDVSLKVEAETDEKSVKDCDVVILAIRNYHFDESTLSKVVYFASKGSKVISFLNGVEHMERLRSVINDNQIIGGSAFIDSRLSANGEIVHRGQEPTIILGSLKGNITSEIKKMSSALEKAGVKCIIAEDLMKSLWRKYLFVMMGTLTGVANSSIGGIVSNSWLNNTLERFAHELKSVAEREKVKLDDASVNEMLLEIRGMRKEWKSLLAEDLESGKRTELDSLWGYLIRKAEKHKLNLPISEMSYGILKLRESADR